MIPVIELSKQDLINFFDLCEWIKDPLRNPLTTQKVYDGLLAHVKISNEYREGVDINEEYLKLKEAYDATLNNPFNELKSKVIKGDYNSRVSYLRDGFSKRKNK